MADCLTKRDIVMRIAEETGLRQSDVKEVVQKTLDGIIEALAEGKKVELRNFGIFTPVVRKARIGRNPNKPEIEVKIPEKIVADFKPGRIMKIKVEVPTGK